MQDRDFTPDDSPAYTAEFNSGETAYAPSRTAAVLAPVPGGRGKSVTRRKPSGPPVAFDEAYLQGLAEGDSEVEAHFVEYFSALLFAKLRFHLRSDQEVQELRQEVFLRILLAIRQGCGIQRPERLGAYVKSVCNNVLLEYFRHKSRVLQFEEGAPEPADSRTDMESELVTEENETRVRSLLAELPPKDRNILKALFFEEREKDRVCRDFGVTRAHLRVLLHRAKERFRQLRGAEGFDSFGYLRKA